MTRLGDSGLLLSQGNNGCSTMMFGNKHSSTNVGKDKRVNTSSNNINSNTNNNTNTPSSTRSNRNMISQIKTKARANKTTTNNMMTPNINTNHSTTSLPNGIKTPFRPSTL